MAVVVQEFDGCFPHNIQIEDLVSSHELPCHSKIRKYVCVYVCMYVSMYVQ